MKLTPKPADEAALRAAHEVMEYCKAKEDCEGCVFMQDWGMGCVLQQDTPYEWELKKLRQKKGE